MQPDPEGDINVNAQGVAVDHLFDERGVGVGRRAGHGDLFALCHRRRIRDTEPAIDLSRADLCIGVQYQIRRTF